MRSLSASVLLFFAAAVTLAQTSNSSSVILTIPSANASNGCPVDFSASRQADFQTMLASDRSQPGPAQGLHLMLSHLNTPAIQSIEVTVYGISPRLRTLPVDVPSSDTISKTFELQRQTGSNSLTEGDVWMHNVGSLNRVDLISITYTDGTTWHATNNLKCRVVPSNFVLVTRW
jgi:hypothetical protein